MKIIGIILAGGKSSRFGEDKATCVYQEKTFIEHILSSIAASKYKINSVISSSSHLHAKYGNTVSDIIPETGPLGGIYSVSEKDEADYYLCISCDTPLVSPVLIDTLIENTIQNEKSTICKLDRTHPLIACYTHGDISKIKSILEQGQRAVMRWIDQLDAQFVEPAVNEVHNVNTPEDLITMTSQTKIDLNVLYFGILSEKTGLENENYSLSLGSTVGELLEKIILKHNSLNGLKFKIAVNKSIENHSYILNTSTEIALLPPFAGG